MLAFLVLSSLVLSSLAYPGGAPEDACDLRLPGHGYEPQTSPAPYMLEAKNLNNGKYEVTLKSKDSSTFKGFLLVALDAANNKYIGSFNEPADVSRKLTCDQGIAATHTGRTDKTQVKLEWTKPASFKGPIKFVATVVQQFDTFWVDINAPVTIQ